MNVWNKKFSVGIGIKKLLFYDIIAKTNHFCWQGMYDTYEDNLGSQRRIYFPLVCSGISTSFIFLKTKILSVVPATK